MSEVDELRKRLDELEGGSGGGKKRPSAVAAIGGVAAIAALGGVVWLTLQEEPEPLLPTAQPEEFQAEGDGFGEIEPFVPPAPPEPEVVEVPVQPNAELLEQLAALRAEIEELRNAEAPVVEDDTAAAEAIEALTAQIAALQEASQNAQEQFAEALEERDRELRQLQADLELAMLDQGPDPALQQRIRDLENRILEMQAMPGPTEVDLLELERQRLAAEEEARRLAELERRRLEEEAFQQARIQSPTIAFGGAGGQDGELVERTFGEVTDFVLNGALPTQVTQAEVIANPGNTVI